MKLQGSKESWLEALRENAASFRAVAAEADLAAPVPTCPQWTVLDLLHHLGGVCRWVTAIVTRGSADTPDPQLRETLLRGDFPPAGETLRWYDEQMSAVIKLLESLDPQQPAWNWAPRPKVALFWHRRAAHEMAVHRWDIQMAQGMAEPIEASLAADGVAEVLDTWLPAGRRTGPRDRHGVIQLVATDVQQKWYVRLRGDGVALLDTSTLFDDTDPNEQVIAAGTASDLDLALWGRVGWDVLDVQGDESLLKALRTG